MFGEKAKTIDAQSQRIAELEQKLADADVKAHPHLLLAQQIEADVQRLMDEGATDIDAAMSMAIDRLRDDMVDKALEAKLRNIPIMNLLRAFDERIGNDEVNKYLAKYALAEFKKRQDIQYLLDIRYEAARTHQVDLSKLQLNSIVTIGLFNHNEREYQSYEHRNMAGRTFVGIIKDVKKPHKLTIFEDTINYDHYAKEEYLETVGNYSKLAQVEFGKNEYKSDGRRAYNPSNEYIDPYINYGTHLSIKMNYSGARVDTFHNNDVGYVMVDDIVILDNPDDMKVQIAAEQQF